MDWLSRNGKCWRTAVGAGAWWVLTSVASAAAEQSCPGDCNGDAVVTVDEVVSVLRVVLEEAPASSCAAGDVNADRRVSVNEVVQAVHSLLSGCTPRCGDGAEDGDEDCDHGGICLGTSKAGSGCTSDSDCFGTSDEWCGVCQGGTYPYKACNRHSDCPQGRCVACWTFGGDGCAANCTLERTLPLELRAAQPGDVNSGSFLAIKGNLLEFAPLPIEGSLRLALGRARRAVESFAVGGPDSHKYRSPPWLVSAFA